MSMEKEGKKTVADMISVFSAAQSTGQSMLPRPINRSHPPPQSRKDFSPLRKDPTTDVKPKHSDCIDTKARVKSGVGSPSAQKTIVVSEKDNTVVASDNPRIARTLGYFGGASNRSFKRPQNPSAPVIKSGYSSYGDKKCATLPSRKSQSTSSIVPEKHPGGVVYRKTSVPYRSKPTSTSTGSSQPISVPTSPSGSSKGSPGIKQAGGTWFPRNTKPLSSTPNESLRKGGAIVKRSQSFTSRVSIDIVPEEKKDKAVNRSSLVIENESVPNKEQEPAVRGDSIAREDKKQSPPRPLPKPRKSESPPSNLQSPSHRMSVKERVSSFSASEPKTEASVSSKPSSTNASSPYRSVPVSVKKTSIPAPVSVKRINISKPVENESKTNIPIPAPKQKSKASASKQNSDESCKNKTVKSDTSTTQTDKHTCTVVSSAPALTRPSVGKRTESVRDKNNEKDKKETSLSSKTSIKGETSVTSPLPAGNTGSQRRQPPSALRKIESPVFIPVSKTDKHSSNALQQSQSVPSEVISGGGVKSMIARFSQSQASPPILKPRNHTPTGGAPPGYGKKFSLISDSSEVDTEDEDETLPSQRLRIPSGKDNEDDLCLDVFDDDFEKEVVMLSENVKEGSHDGEQKESVTEGHIQSNQPVVSPCCDGYVSDENCLNGPAEVKKGFVDSEGECATLTKDKQQVDEGDHTHSPAGDDDQPTISSSIYSNMYQEYTLKHKQCRSSFSSSSLAPETPKALEAIPENDIHVSVPVTPSPVPSKLEPMGSSSDSERELFRKMSNVSMSFYDEVLATINKTIGPATEQAEDQTEHITQVVGEIVRNSQQAKKHSDPEDIYETIEDVSRKVSDYVIRHRRMERESREEVPPELPPRPVFLMKLQEVQEREEVSILGSSPQTSPVDPYVEMHTSNPTDPVDDYEPIMFSPRSPKKNKKSPKRSIKKKSPDRQQESSGVRNEQETRQRIGSRSDNSRVGVKKKKYINLSLFRSKVEPKENTEKLSSTLPVTEYEILEYNNDSSIHKSYSSEYVNTCKHELIPPINTSESEGEDPTLMMSDVSSTLGKQSPTKVKCRGDVLPTMAPDSGMFPELQNNRYLRNPMTPPLVTKLGVMPSVRTNPGLRFSNSDPALHMVLQVSSRRNGPVPESPSFSHMSVNSDEEYSQTPSVSSFESGKCQELPLPRSPALRKRVKSDASCDRPSSSVGAVQKNYLLNYALTKRRGSLPGIVEPESVIEVPLVRADALMDCSSSDPEELSFTVNDVIAVLDMTDDDWWQGMVEDRVGWFPASWVRLRIGQEEPSSLDNAEVEAVINSQQSFDNREGMTNGHVDHEQDDKVEDLPSPSGEGASDGTQRQRKISRRMTITKRSTGEFPRRLTPIQIRAKCIEEILTTEKVYVQHLQDIVEGFLEPCEQHSNLFTPDRIEAIFSNIKEIYKFQQEFLSELQNCINTDQLQDSQIGELFVRMGDQFCIYSEYCNNHPHAVNEMNQLHEEPQYTYFFESCRLLRNLTDISLEGFLLTPVQRICRYPLQLSELVKNTPEDHPDYRHVVNGQKEMTKVAMVINEQKKRMEDIGKICLWQDTVDGWKGPEVLERSTELIHYGELHKISKGHSQERHFFLFDHQMIYCKKDAIGGKLSYKGRIDTDKCTVIDLKDGEMTHGGSSVKNAWKMNNADKDDKLYVLYAKSSQAKEQWMESFARERQRVAEDAKRGFVLTPKMKRAAISLSIATSAPIRRRSFSKKAYVAIDTTTANSIVADLSVNGPQIKAKVDSNGSFGSPNETRKKLKNAKKR